MIKVIYKTKHWHIIRNTRYLHYPYAVACEHCEWLSGNVTPIGEHGNGCDNYLEVPEELIKFFKMIRYLNKVL